jgi:hypothetical protein
MSNTNLPNFENIHDHINKLINGKIGCLAKELAEETAKDLDFDVNNINSPEDIYKQLFKNPGKLMGIVSNIGNKIDKKVKDGSLKESEILEEANDLLKNMKSIPGMDNFEDLLKSMNLDKLIPKGGKINNNAFEHMMNQNIKMSKMKERMKKKAQENRENNEKQTTQKNTNPNINLDSNKLDAINSNLNSLLQQMNELQNSQKNNNNNNDYLNDVLKQNNVPGSAKKRKAVNKKKVKKN